MKVLFVIIVSLSAFFSCSRIKKDVLNIAESKFERPIVIEEIQKPAKVNKEEYISFVSQKSSGLAVDKEVGDITYSVLYKPQTYVALEGLNKDSVLKEEDFLNEQKSIEDLQYFTFKIGIKNFQREILLYKVQSEKEYEDRVNYFAFYMQHDLKLIEGQDTLPCVLFHFERNYGVAPNANFVLAFEKSSNENLLFNKTLFFDDKIFGNGRIYLTINKESIAQVPELNIN